MTKRMHCLGAAALVALFASRTEAQITAVFVPPERAAAQQQEEARREAAANDSVARVTLTNMKEWVDSAATALAISPDTGVASATNPSPAANGSTPDGTAPDGVVAGDRASSKPTPQAEPEFRDGARAPDTATGVPFVALAGALLIVLGALLSRSDRVRVRVRHRR